MKPNSLFFDEAYSETYHRKDTVIKFVDECDCLVIIGSSLQTNLSKQIVSTLLDKELPVIEINAESAIDRGYNLQVLGRPEDLVVPLFDAYYAQRQALVTQGSGAGSQPAAAGE